MHMCEYMHMCVYMHMQKLTNTSGMARSLLVKIDVTFSQKIKTDSRILEGGT